MRLKQYRANKTIHYFATADTCDVSLQKLTMTIETLQTICHKLPGVTEDIKLGEHLCFNVGGKSFLFTHPDGVPPSASFKVPAEDFEDIISKEGLEPQPYIARYKWVLARDISSLGQKEWEHYIQQSYRLIADKLPGKVKKELGL
jgi:predicted DNA-binding protein (MmcQ/YjbR family)